MSDRSKSSDFNRRAFLAAAASTAAASRISAATPLEQSAHSAEQALPQHVDVTLKVNGLSRALSIDSRTTLLDALREVASRVRQAGGQKRTCPLYKASSCVCVCGPRRCRAEPHPSLFDFGRQDFEMLGQARE